MTALATTYDVQLRLGRALNGTEERRVDALLADASAAIRSYTGQTITEATSTTTLRVRRSRVLLPQRPVTAVSSVLDPAGTAVTCAWRGFDWIELTSTSAIYDFAWESWTAGLVAVTVTYHHGYPAVPDDIVGVCAAVTLRALGQSPTQGGLTSESIEGYSYQIGTVGAAGGFGLLPDEKAILDRYRRHAGWADISLR